jgi:hypothetical protein
MSTCSMSGDAWTFAFWADTLRGSSVVVCDATAKGNGRCDGANNMDQDSCGHDGGDCCMTTCYENCVARQQLAVVGTDSDIAYSFPLGLPGQCAYMCGVVASPGTNCPYKCLSDDYMGKGSDYTQWCAHDRGTQVKMSECFKTQEDVVNMLTECLMDSTSHGTSATANARCGNQTLDCSFSDVQGQIDGCHLHPSLCTNGACCSVAIERGWLDPTVRELPTACELFDICDGDPECFPTLAQCGRTNKSCRGGCCKCTPTEWFGHDCDRPLCWPKCVNGACVAPNVCYCDANWSGPSCETPVCNPSCIPGQGVCVGPNSCECFYGFEGVQCELPRSNPPCVNGVAIAPDVCQCDSGWGGRICDYPLCQSYPDPSSDCGHGTCDAPWTCKCEPGWSLTIPVGTDGMDILPTYWNGRDVSSFITPANFVFGDTRFTQSDVKTYVFNQYNAFKCNTPNCRLLVNPHCARCVDISGDCLECDPGLYLTAGTCKKCSIAFPRCRLCTESRCVLCDPLFSMVDGLCISDGIVEFASPFYHVLANAGSVELKVVRAVDSIDLEWSRRAYIAEFGVSFTAVTVPSRDVSSQAIFASQDFFADYELINTRVVFGAAASIPADPTTRSDLRAVFTDSLTGTISVPIFDNLIFDPTVKSFKVKLIADPSTVPGFPSPLRPLPGIDTFNAYDYVLDETEIFIWDANNFDYRTCGIADSFFASSDPFSIADQTFSIPVKCSKCTEVDSTRADGCATWTVFDSADNVKVVTRTVTNLESIVTSTATGSFDADGNLLVAAALPQTAGVEFDATVQIVYPGVIASQFLWTSVAAMILVPDMKRLQPVLNSEWNQAQTGPALSQFDGFLHFGCITGTSQTPSAVGFAVSQGSLVSLTLDGVLVIDNVQRAIYDVSATGADWQAQTDFTLSVCSATAPDGLICYYRVDGSNNPMQYPIDDVVPFSVSYRASPLYPRNPAGVRFLMHNSDDGGVTTTWKVIPNECLYGGVEIADSPIRSLQTTT